MSADSLAPVLPQAISHFLRDTRRRLRLHAALTGAGYGLAVGLAFSVAICIIARLRPLLLPDQVLTSALAAVAIGTILGLLVGATRPLPLRVVAARADHDLGLRERLSTALELADGTAHSSLAGQHFRETAALVAGRRDTAATWPRPSRDATLVLAALVAALLALLILPNAQTTAILRQQQNQQLVQAAAQQVAQVQARVTARGALDPATQQALQQQLNQLQQDLLDGKIDPTAAVARLAEAEAQLRRVQDPAATNRGAALPKLADEFGTFGATAPIGQKLQSQDYAGAGQALKDFASQLAALDPASRAALAQKLREAAASQAATDPQLARQLQDAADALDRGDIAAAQAALNAAGDQVTQTGQALAGQAALSGALGDLNAIKRDVANGVSPTTANATPQLPRGTPGIAGSPIAIGGSPVPYNGTPFTGNGTPIALNGTPVYGSLNGTPISGSPPPNATPVIVPGQGQGQGQPIQGGQPGQGQGQPGQGQGQGSGPGGTAPYDPVYAPTLPGGAPGQRQTIPGQGGGDTPPTGTTQGAGANTNPTVPYNQVYQQYRDQALQGLDDPNIPPELREYIRQYFSNIDPNNPAGQP